MHPLATTVWWHVYPLGFVGAPHLSAADPAPSVPGPGDPVTHRLPALTRWLPHAADLGCTGVLLGPVFASETHGYDTVDHFRIDPRLGDEADLLHLVRTAHDLGLRVALDGVFNHVGRGFGPFRQALREGPSSPAARWFRLHWPQDGGEPGYDTFEGHRSLVALEHGEPAVAEHVRAVLLHWLDRGVDGWRLDAAYAVPAAFWRPVLDDVRARHPQAWFAGEMIHGDYAGYVRASGLDTVTQYELWKALWSSLNDVNLFELAWALERHAGFCAAFPPLTFVGNHDVTRIRSRLADPRHLGHALALLFALPGTPCVYYGDEFGLTGVTQDRPGGDDAVRPAFPEDPGGVPAGAAGDGTLGLHRELIALRRRNPWLAAATEVRMPYLKNEAGAVEVAGDGRLVVLLNLDDHPHHFPVDLAEGDVEASSARPVAGDRGVVEPHGWRIVRRPG